jgi:4-hydroxy-tetrahydrodipicolinate reductase
MNKEKLKIALIGYGKMGKAIEEIAVKQGHEIVLKISSQNLDEFNHENLKLADVAIEFSNPHNAFSNIIQCLDAGIPVVCGSTGWTEKLNEVEAHCSKCNSSFIYASNFSVGVNIFFEVNKKLAMMMNNQSSYEVLVEEIHHTEKKDAPSGTGISIADQIIDSLERKKFWVNHISDNPEELEIISERIDPAPGTHKVKYSSVIDDIEIIHTAHNRQGFAFGAVLAAEFIQNKKGIFSMADVLDL